MVEKTWDSLLTSNEDIVFIVEKNQIKKFLAELDNDVDDEGFIIEKSSKKKVISQDEGEIKLNELGSISSGSKVFIKKNLASYSEFLSEKRKS